MRLCICGGRDFVDVDFAIPRIHRIHQHMPVSVLICGMAKGADSIGHAWAKYCNIPIEEFFPDWKGHGKKAGIIRNISMLEKGKPDFVLALPGGNGTAHMVEISRQAGIDVIQYQWQYFSRAEDPVWGFLSNFYPSDFIDDGIAYPSNEHYYQSQKTLDPEARQWIINSPMAVIAKRRGNDARVPRREDWKTFKLEAMMAGLRLKFPVKQHELSDRLLKTADNYLVEFAPWGDTFWGINKNHKGQNWLGRLLTRRRDEILCGI